MQNKIVFHLCIRLNISVEPQNNNILLLITNYYSKFSHVNYYNKLKMLTGTMVFIKIDFDILMYLDISKSSSK